MVGAAVPVDRSIRPYDMSCCPPVQTPEPSGPFPHLSEPSGTAHLIAPVGELLVSIRRIPMKLQSRDCGSHCRHPNRRSHVKILHCQVFL